jgi:hypothetical protein
VLELGIFASHGIWMFRYRKQRREEKQAKKDGKVELEAVDEEARISSQENVPPLEPAQGETTADQAPQHPERIEQQP